MATAARKVKTLLLNQDQSKRTSFLIKEKSGKRGRPKLVKICYEASALGILLKYKIITLVMYQSAQQFTEWRRAVFGSPFISASNLYNIRVDRSYREKGISTTPSIEEESLEKDYKNFINKLKKNNRLGLEEIMNVAIYDRLPGWVLRSHPRPSDERRRQALLRSLAFLTRYFEKQENKR